MHQQYRDYEILDTLHFDKYHLNRSGNKGEGIITVDTLLWPYTKGAGMRSQWRRCGNGLFSGGGGGGNYWQGGDGGRQSSLCVNDTLVRAWGGLACDSLYKNDGGVIMGGGGGSGVQNLSDIKYGHQWWQRRGYYFNYYRHPGREKRTIHYQPTGKVLLHRQQAVPEAVAEQGQLYWMQQIIQEHCQ